MLGVKCGYGRTYILSGENFGHFYEGNFSNDLYDGEGRYIWPDQDEYKGEFKAG